MKEFDIEFWDGDTARIFKECRQHLIEHSDMTALQATQFLEKIYYVVAREFEG